MFPVLDMADGDCQPNARMDAWEPTADTKRSFLGNGPQLQARACGSLIAGKMGGWATRLASGLLSLPNEKLSLCILRCARIVRVSRYVQSGQNNASV